ncbi:MAG: hypothetical protein JW793_10930 [Acidobacteria bacterium]|nr:hypothetical protein [Acidobacteriota bacterium]
MKIRGMNAWSGVAVSACFILSFCAAPCFPEVLTPVYKTRIDALIVTAYQTAAAQFPCKMKTDGKPAMIRWQDVEACLNGAEERIDWENLTRQIEALREEGGFSRTDVYQAVESAMEAHALQYDRVFSVEKKDALLPLSNTVLKFLPKGSLIDLPVFSKRLREKIGTFAGAFTYERSGGLSAANTYRLSLFQYKDAGGDLQTPAIGNRLLLDSFGVPWEDASKQPGFRLTVDSLTVKYLR